MTYQRFCVTFIVLQMMFLFHMSHAHADDISRGLPQSVQVDGEYLPVEVVALDDDEYEELRRQYTEQINEGNTAFEFALADIEAIRAELDIISEGVFDLLEPQHGSLPDTFQGMPIEQVVLDDNAYNNLRRSYLPDGNGQYGSYNYYCAYGNYNGIFGCQYLGNQQAVDDLESLRDQMFDLQTLLESSLTPNLPSTHNGMPIAAAVVNDPTLKQQVIDSLNSISVDGQLWPIAAAAVLNEQYFNELEGIFTSNGTEQSLHYLNRLREMAVLRGRDHEQPQTLSAYTPVRLDAYSRPGTTITVSNDTRRGANVVNMPPVCFRDDMACSRFTIGSASVTLKCVKDHARDANGDEIPGTLRYRWSVQSGSGRCIESFHCCYGPNTPIEHCATVFGNQAIDSVQFTEYSKCSSPDPEKNYCVFNYSGVDGITGETGDDMFKISTGAGAYFEYMNMPSSSGKRLTYLSHPGVTPGSGLMMPSGPPGTYTDYSRFVEAPPAGVEVDEGCYPVEVRLCETGHALPRPPKIDGECGDADDENRDEARTYTELAQIPPEDFCWVGDVVNTSTTASKIRWQCNGLFGGDTSRQCEATRTIDGQCGDADTAPNGLYSALVDVPEEDFCFLGEVANKIEDDEVIQWECEGLHGGDSASCETLKPVDGECGSSHGETVDDLADVADFCEKGEADDKVETLLEVTWKCEGQYGGDDAACRADRPLPPPPVCGTTTPPNCANGSRSAVSNISGEYRFTCSVPGHPDLNCAVPIP